MSTALTYGEEEKDEALMGLLEGKFAKHVSQGDVIDVRYLGGKAQ